MRACTETACFATGLPPCDLPGGTPAGPPAFCKSQIEGGSGSPRMGVGDSPLAQRLLAIVFTMISTPVAAAGSGMPWEAPLQRILESIEGPVAKVIAVVIIIVTGLSLAFGDMGGGLRRLLQIVFGLSIAFAATSFFLTFFSFAGGALID